MGKLLQPRDFDWGGHDRNRGGLDPRLYFPDLRWSSTGGAHVCDFAVAFPFRASIHTDWFEEDRYGDKPKPREGELLVALRKFVERDIPGDVLLQFEDLKHVHVYPQESSLRPGKRLRTDIRHGYRHFLFETEAERDAFVARFAGQVSEPSGFHPDYVAREAAGDGSLNTRDLSRLYELCGVDW